MSAANHPAAKPIEDRSRLENRFWEKVEIGSDDECWEWQASTFPDGYGAFRFAGRMHGAHRIAWMLVHGEMPDEQINHRCDNRECVNTRHIYEGSHFENMLDAAERSSMGTVLSKEEIRDVRDRYAAGGITQKELADEYCTTQQSISRIIRRAVHDFND